MNLRKETLPPTRKKRLRVPAFMFALVMLALLTLVAVATSVTVFAFGGFVEGLMFLALVVPAVMTIGMFHPGPERWSLRFILRGYAKDKDVEDDDRRTD